MIDFQRSIWLEAEWSDSGVVDTLSESIDNVRRMEIPALGDRSYSLLRSSWTLNPALWTMICPEARRPTRKRSGICRPERLPHDHEVYLEHLRQCKAAVNIPILASLNGASAGGWLSYAKEMEQQRGCH